MKKNYPVLDYLNKYLNDNLNKDDSCFMNYPTAISQTLKIEIEEISLGQASVSIATKPKFHANQQGTIHGGLLCELADAAIGTAHSTLMQENESFTSLDLNISFYRPVWEDKLTAKAKPLKDGKKVTHYECTIYNSENKKVAYITSNVLTLQGEEAKGR